MNDRKRCGGASAPQPKATSNLNSHGSTPPGTEATSRKVLRPRFGQRLPKILGNRRSWGDPTHPPWVGAEFAASIPGRGRGELCSRGRGWAMAVAVAFDEMKGTDGALRPAYGELSRWLGEVPPDVLDYRRREAELLFRRIGITFAVYGEADAQERLIPFDVLPRILAAAEWDILRAGLEQRVKAINLYSATSMDAREILKAGVVPEDLVFQNPVFRPEMNGQKVPHDIYVHIAGIDIVRVDAETFYVLEDNARTPSGVSYMLENREIMLRLFPELFARHRVAPVENYPDELLATLKSVAPANCQRRSDRRAAHARRLQLGLLRAFLPGRQARHRAGRRPRPVRQGRRRLHAHDRRGRSAST